MSVGNFESSETRSTRVRTLARFGSVLGVFAMLVFLSGCPVVPTTCTTDDDCSFCDGATCGSDGVCAAGTAPCTDAQICDESARACFDCASDTDCDDGDDCTEDTCSADGTCVNDSAMADAACDDGDLCNGTEACDPAGGCVDGTPPCAADEVCDPADGSCSTMCLGDADCDLCLGETCVSGVCTSGTPIDCDDGDLCTTDTCAAGVCSNTAVVCATGEVCDATTGACVTDNSCAIDSDCDDGLFCNGTETCDTVALTCTAGTNPCAADQTCDEATDSCTGGAPKTFALTLGTDSGPAFTGGSADDTFNAFLVFNPPTGDNRTSLQTQDTIDGGGGNDTLNAQFSAAANTLTSFVSNIETINITDFGTGTTTYSATNTTGAAEFNSISSTQDVIVTNVPGLVNLGITNSTQDLSVTFLTAATTATDDTMTLRLNNATGGTTTNQTITITTGTSNGVETLNIVSSGTANSVKQITQATGNTMGTVNVSGDMKLTVNDPLDNSVTTQDCTAATGGCELSLGNGNNTFTGGPGDDMCTFSLANFDASDTVDGGAGTDTLSLVSADADNATKALTNVSNIEGLTVSDAMAGAVNSTFYGTIGTVTVEAGITGGNTLTVADGTTINFGKKGVSNDSAGNNTIAIAGLGTNDDVTLNYNDSDSGGSTTLSGIEACTLNSNVGLDGAAADGGANVFTGAFSLPDVAGSSLTIGGTEDCTFSAAVTARTINASGFAQKLTMTLNASGSTATSTIATGGGSITGGTGDDVLVGSTAGDTISGGGGKDVIQPGRGIDTVNFSGGSNIVDLEDLNVANAVSANRDTITGFTADGTAYTTTNEEDAIRFDNIGTLGDLSDGAVASEMQTITTPANVTAAAGVSIVELAFETSSSVDLDNDLTGALLLSACGGTTGTTACTFTTQGNDEDIVIIAYQSGAAYIYHGNGAGANTALIGSEISLIAVVTGNVTVGGFDVTQFIN